MVSVGPNGVRRDRYAARYGLTLLFGAVQTALLLTACMEAREYEETVSGVGGTVSGGAPTQGAGGKTIPGAAGRGGSLGSGGSSAGGNANSGGSATVPPPAGSGGAPSVGGAPAGGKTGAGGTNPNGGSTGSAGAAMLASTMASLNLGTVEVGTSSSTATWRIENRGGSPTGVPTLINGNQTEIAIASNTCVAAIPPGQACTIEFTLRPGAGGNRTGTLTLSAAPGGTLPLTILGAGGYRVTVSVAGGTSGTSVTSTPAGIDCGSTCTALLSGNVKLTATTQNGSGVFHTAWGGDATNCLSAPSRDCTLSVNQARAVTVRFSPLSNNLIFATSAAVSIMKGSAAAYDADCNAAATAAGINNAAGTDYVAVVSDSVSAFRTRLGSTARGWVRRDGLPFSDTQTALFTTNVVWNPVRFDELGNLSKQSSVLSGTETTGIASTYTCENWTVNTAGSSFIGATVFGGPHAWVYGLSAACTFSGTGVLCMGKSRTAQLINTPVTGRRIWLTTTPYTMNGTTTPDQKCQSERPSGVVNARALLATTNRSAASVLDLQATYVRPDGVVVGTGSLLAGGGELQSGIWQRADLSYSLVASLGRFWTGQTTLLDVGTAATTCDNWTATTGTGNWSGSYETRGWWNDHNDACTQTLQLRCVEVP